MRIKLTEKAISDLLPGDREYRAYFDGLPGFGVKVFPSGSKSYFMDYTTVGGSRRRMSLGNVAKLQASTAKNLYRKNMGIVATGGDPLGTKEKVGAVPTLSDWIDQYIEFIRPFRKSVDSDKKYLLDTLSIIGNVRINKITRDQIYRCIAKVSERGNYTANRCRAAVCSCLSSAVDRGLIDKNPAARIRAYSETPRDRVLSDDEVAALLTAVKREDPWTEAAFIVLVETGCRHGEILGATWDQFDLAGAWWTIPAGVAKSKKAETIPINQSVVCALRKIGPGEPEEAVIKPLRRGSRGDGHRHTLNSTWKKIKKNAGLPSDLRIHDIRRTFGLRVCLSHGIHIASKLLRHSSIKITEQAYAPLGVEVKGQQALRMAVEN